MKITDLSTVSRIAKSMVFCAGVMLASTSLSEARKVSVYLTSERFGNGESVHATSGTRKIPAATEYSYDLNAKIRGQSGKPIEKIVKPGTDIASFVELVSPGSSSFLSGTFSNPGGTLPATLINKKFTGTKNIKGFGSVKFSFIVVGEILANGQCVVDVKKVKIVSTPNVTFGSVIFTKGSTLDISTVP
ncbi:MAG: hypothetical protein ABI162_16425 [Luteolibacter sp.]